MVPATFLLALDLKALPACTQGAHQAPAPAREEACRCYTYAAVWTA